MAVTFKVGYFPLWLDEYTVGGKTAYTSGAGRCFVGVAEHETRMIIVAVLRSSSRRNLLKETEKLITKGFQMTMQRKSRLRFPGRLRESSGLFELCYLLPLESSFYP